VLAGLSHGWELSDIDKKAFYLCFEKRWQQVTEVPSDRRLFY
jgi:hypothetical protein